MQTGTEDAAHLGGLAFDSAEAVESGAQLLLRFPSLDPDFVARACVAWCDVTDGGYRIGVTFFDAGDAFRSRMLEQICAIQAHARTLRENDDQERTDNEVACEWIDRSGSAFPNP